MQKGERAKVIELAPDSDGVFKPTGKVVKEVEVKKRKQKIEKPRSTSRVQIQDPLQQFIYGANSALDFIERLRKTFK